MGWFSNVCSKIKNVVVGVTVSTFNFAIVFVPSVLVGTVATIGCYFGLPATAAGTSAIASLSAFFGAASATAILPISMLIGAFSSLLVLYVLTTNATTTRERKKAIAELKKAQQKAQEALRQTAATIAENRQLAASAGTARDENATLATQLARLETALREEQQSRARQRMADQAREAEYRAETDQTMRQFQDELGQLRLSIQPQQPVPQIPTHPQDGIRQRRPAAGR